MAKASSAATNSELLNAKPKPMDQVRCFISQKLPHFGWGQSHVREMVLDVGCGSGLNTFQLILPLFSQSKKILAIDTLRIMIEFARSRNSHRLIEYYVADIENWCTVQRWEGLITNLISINGVQWLRDKRLGFRNMHKLLRPGGEMAFYFVMATPLYMAMRELENNPKWNKYFQYIDNSVCEDRNKLYGATCYKRILEEIGFDILYIEEQILYKQFSSDEECREFLASKCALVSRVPDQQKEEFKDELFQFMLRLDGRDSSGRPVHRNNIVELIMRKRFD